MFVEKMEYTSRIDRIVASIVQGWISLFKYGIILYQETKSKKKRNVECYSSFLYLVFKACTVYARSYLSSSLGHIVP